VTDTLTNELVETSRRLLEAELPVPRGMEPEPLVQRWKEVRPHLEELGWFDLLDDPGSGGLGLSPEPAVRLLRLAGSHLVPGPVVESVLTVPWLRTRPDVQAGALHDAQLQVTTVDPCLDLPVGRDRQPILLQNGRLQGRVRCVLGAGDTDALLVHARQDASEALLVVPATHPGVRVDPLRGADPCQSVGHVELDCLVGDEHLVRSSEASLPAALRAWTRLGYAALLAGISERVLALGVDHANQREQFGRRIGSFQAVQHLLAEVAVTAESLSNVVAFAADQLSVVDRQEAVLTAVAAKARASTEAVVACETVLQVLGGIGFTVEHPLHHYLKRAVSLAAQAGTPAELHHLSGRSVLAQRTST
jgi:alkylation response protein AidB-like acyl-CoA dehydrogenase